jgi:hypothetical protein
MANAAGRSNVILNEGEGGEEDLESMLMLRRVLRDELGLEPNLGK